MARVYADAAALAAYPGGDAVTEGVDLLLRHASHIVDTLLLGVVYDVDAATELPTDPDVAQSMEDATCAIAVEANAAGILEAGNTREWGSVSIGSVSLSDPQDGDDSPTVMGVPIPSAARIALASIGRLTVVSW